MVGKCGCGGGICILLCSCQSDSGVFRGGGLAIYEIICRARPRLSGLHFGRGRSAGGGSAELRPRGLCARLWGRRQQHAPGLRPRSAPRASQGGQAGSDDDGDEARVSQAAHAAARGQGAGGGGGRGLHAAAGVRGPVLRGREGGGARAVGDAAAQGAALGAAAHQPHGLPHRHLRPGGAGGFPRELRLPADPTGLCGRRAD
mmetsp:Transcript_7791/g.14723  ORF Transcript_7791/g.14723 Transcript_7791/m.14723 type:complete len:202 (-) Transcript_7791:1893-2498(-)